MRRKFRQPRGSTALQFPREREHLAQHRIGQQAPVDRSTGLHADGGRDVRDLRGESGLVAVDADPGDDIVHRPRLRLDGKLRQDAAELSAVVDEIVCPLDADVEPCRLQDRAADGDGGHRREVHDLLRQQAGAEHDAEIKSARLGGEAAPAAALAGGLPLGQDARPGGTAVGGQLPRDGIRRGDFLIDMDVCAGIPGDDRGIQPVGQGSEAITPARGSLDGVALLPELVDGLPDRRAADAQGAAHLLAGDGCGCRVQHIQNFIFCHCKIILAFSMDL